MSQYASFVISSWQDDRHAARNASSHMRWRVHCVRQDDELRFPDATFVVRTWIENDGQLVRGVIRHVQSGREMQFQTGKPAIEFIRAWLGDSTVSVEYDSASA